MQSYVDLEANELHATIDSFGNFAFVKLGTQKVVNNIWLYVSIAEAVGLVGMLLLLAKKKKA